MFSPSLSNMSVDLSNVEEPSKSLEDALLEDATATVPETQEEVLKEQQYKIDMLIQENLQQREVLKQKDNEYLILKKKVDEQAQNLDRLLKYSEELKQGFNANSSVQMPMAPNTAGPTDKSVEKPPIPAPRTNFCSNNGQSQSHQFSFASVVPVDHTSSSGSQMSHLSSGNPFAQIQRSVEKNSNIGKEGYSSVFPPNINTKNNPFLDPLPAQSESCSPFVNTQNISASQSVLSSNNPFKSNITPTANPWMDKSSKKPFFSNNNRKNSKSSANRSTQELHFNNRSTKNNNFMMPYGAWLKKHNMKENQTFRGTRGGNPQKRQFFAQKYARNKNDDHETNATLRNVASYHIALAKEAVDDKSQKNRKFRQ